MMKKIVLVVLMLLVASSSYANEFDLKIIDASVREAAAVIAAKGNVHVIVDDNVDVAQKISMNFTKITPQQALMMLTTTPRLALSWDGNVTYLVSQISIESSKVLQNESAQNSPKTQTPQTSFQYKYPSGSSVALKNVSIGDVLRVITTSCNVGTLWSFGVDRSEIIQQITIPQMTPEVALQALAKATGLVVTKTKSNGYLITKDAADRDKIIDHLFSNPPIPQKRRVPYFIEPLILR